MTDEIPEDSYQEDAMEAVGVKKYVFVFAGIYAVAIVVLMIASYFVDFSSSINIVTYIAVLFVALGSFVNDHKRDLLPSERKSMTRGVFGCSLLISAVLAVPILISLFNSQDPDALQLKEALLSPVFYVIMLFVLLAYYGITAFTVKKAPKILFKSVLKKNGDEI